MGTWSGGRVGLIALVAAVVGVAAGVWISGRPMAGQAQAYQAPRLKGTDKPDLTGIWQAFTTANWDIQDHSAEAGPFPRVLGVWGAQHPGQGVVEGNDIPYRPDMLAKKQENLKKRLTVDHDTRRSGRISSRERVHNSTVKITKKSAGDRKTNQNLGLCVSHSTPDSCPDSRLESDLIRFALQ